MSISEKVQLAIFWDIENCAIPANNSASDVAQNIRDFLSAKHPKCGYAQEFTCACDVRKMKEKITKGLNKNGVVIVHVDSDKKNAADDKLQELINVWINRTAKCSAVLVIISSDIDFGNPIRSALRVGIDVVLIHGNNCSPDLTKQVKELYLFQDVIKKYEPQKIINPNKGTEIPKVFSYFEEFNRVPDTLKTNIKSFYAFDDYNDKNILFTTKDNRVFCFGGNYHGCLGLGGGIGFVEEPQLIEELWFENIESFYNGLEFMLALNNKKQVFGWGSNQWAQLGRGRRDDNIVYEKTVAFRPEKIDYFDNKDIIQLSCGYFHSLALSSLGEVYGWGCNAYGQVGSGSNEKYISKPINLSKLIGAKIKSINCSFNRSFALTLNGEIYSWGENKNLILGHYLIQNDFIFKPTKIIILDYISSVFSDQQNTYFMTDEGYLYFCGLIPNEKRTNFCGPNNKFLTKDVKLDGNRFVPIGQDAHTYGPKYLERIIRFKEIHCVGNRMNNAIAVTHKDNCVYQLLADKIQKTNFNCVSDYYAQTIQITCGTYHINQDMSEVVVPKNSSTKATEKVKLITKAKGKSTKADSVQTKKVEPIVQVTKQIGNTPAPVFWAQNSESVSLRIAVPDVKSPVIKIEINTIYFKFGDTLNDKSFEAYLSLFGELDPDASKYQIRDQGIEFELRKECVGPFWPRLIKEELKFHWIKSDFNKFIDSGSDDDY